MVLISESVSSINFFHKCWSDELHNYSDFSFSIQDEQQDMRIEAVNVSSINTDESLEPAQCQKQSYTTRYFIFRII